MSNKILVAEDETHLRKLVCDYLTKSGFEVVGAADGQEALDLFYKETFALAILDIMMPKVDGLEVLKEIRSVSDMPVVMLTAKNTEFDEIQGFNIGADEYVGKPFSPAILLARVKALLKRSGVNFDNVLTFDELSIYQREREVRVNDKKIILTPKEYELLLHFIQNQGKVFSRENLLSSVWGFDYEGEERTVDTHVKCLRAKLGICGDFIKTLRKVGYKFEATHEIEN